MASLTTKQRKSLPASEFAIPSQRSYPIDTIERARDALARVAANGTPSEQAQVHRAVMAKFPSIDAGNGPSAAPAAPAHATAARVQRQRMNAHA